MKRLRWQSLGELEHIWIPMICQLITILSSLALVLYLLIVRFVYQSSFQVASLSGLAMYTNIRVLFEYLYEDWCQPLERELNFASNMKRPKRSNNPERFESYRQEILHYIRIILTKASIIKENVCFGQCPICLEDMYSAARTTECSHIFHAHCLRKSLELIGDSCPMCRKPILDSLIGKEDVNDLLQYTDIAYWHQQM